MQRALGFVCALALAAGAMRAGAAGLPDCSTFGWNMMHELELLAQPAQSIAAAADAKSAPRIDVDVPYSVRLRPRADVAFAHAPGKDAGGDAGAGGLLVFRPKVAGAYRITLDTGLWVDVVRGGELVASSGFRGRQPCGPIHKSVGWMLSADADLVVQLSGPATEAVRLTITPIPAGDQ